MRLAKRGLILVLVLGALGFLAEHSQVDDAELYNSAIDRCRLLRELSARLDLAALQAQALTMQDYDALTETLRQMDDLQRDLERHVATLSDPRVTQGVKATRHLLEGKESLVEGLLSANSVLRNSSAYLPRAVRAALEAAGPARAGTVLDRRLALLLSDLLSYRSGRAAAELVRFTEGLSALERDRRLAAEVTAPALSSIVRHGRIVAGHGPKVDGAILALLGTDNSRYDHLFHSLRDRQDVAIGRANRFRVGLVALSVLLLAAVVTMFARLGRGARALRGALADLATLNRDLEVRVAARTRELAGSNEQYRLLLETTQAIPWETAPGSLRLAYVGPQAAAALGLPVSDWLAEGFLADRLDPLNRGETLAQLADLARRPGHHELELRMLAADGRLVWFRCLASSGPSGPGAAPLRGILLDVTIQRQLEMELRAAQKLESVGRLASGIAHEINTPVQFVSDGVHFINEAWTGLAQVLAGYRQLADQAVTQGRSPGQIDRLEALLAGLRERECAVDLEYSLENVPGALGSCREGLDRIATIVRSMKEFAHPDQKEKTGVDLNHNIQSTLTIARSEYRQVADVETDLGALPLLLCHAGEINQVVLNIVVNAAHAIADRTKGTSERGRITVCTRQDGEAAVVAIADTGGGIPPAIQGRIFDPFFTTKEVGRGTGQGLAIARSVVERHGGRLFFETEVGVGTTFTIRLPLSTSEATSLTRAA